MKKTYIIPEVIIVNIDIVRPIADSMTLNEDTLVDGNGGWVKEEYPTITNKSIWDEEW